MNAAPASAHPLPQATEVEVDVKAPKVPDEAAAFLKGLP